MRFAYYFSWYIGFCTELYLELHARLVAFGLFKRVEIKYVYKKKIIMRFIWRIAFLEFSGILIGYIILLPPEIVFL